MHFAVPLPSEVVWIRQRRWRVERARRDRNVVRLDVRNRDARLTFLAPFDRPSTVDRVERLRQVRPQHASARLAQLIGRAYAWPTIASAINARIEPVMRAFYADPFVDMHNRMKEALVLLGRLPRAVVRPPLVKLQDAEIARIRQALVEAGLLGKRPLTARLERASVA